MKKTIFILLLFFIGFRGSAAVKFISPLGAGTQNGNSWANAIDGANFQDSLRVAVAGTEFWVAAGAYLPHPTSRDSSFFIPSGVKVFGGFSSTDTTMAQRDWVNNVTTLSGAIGGRVVKRIIVIILCGLVMPIRQHALTAL